MSESKKRMPSCSTLRLQSLADVRDNDEAAAYWIGLPPREVSG